MLICAQGRVLNKFKLNMVDRMGKTRGSTFWAMIDYGYGEVRSRLMVPRLSLEMVLIREMEALTPRLNAFSTFRQRPAL